MKGTHKLACVLKKTAFAERNGSTTPHETESVSSGDECFAAGSSPARDERGVRESVNDTVFNASASIALTRY